MCMNKVCSGPYVHTYTWVSTHPYVPGLGKFIVDPRCAMCILPEMFLGCCEPSLALDISMGRPPSLWSYCPQCTTDHPATVQIQLAANTLWYKYNWLQIHFCANTSRCKYTFQWISVQMQLTTQLWPAVANPMIQKAHNIGSKILLIQVHK